jgi:hypothetical protein
MSLIYFTAKTTGTGTIGCAYIGALCDIEGYNRRQRDKLPGSLSILSKLVAHDARHICSPNVSGSTNVMYSSICGSCNNAFGQTTKDSINNKVADQGCTGCECRS